jgi:lysozyme
MNDGRLPVGRIRHRPIWLLVGSMLLAACTARFETRNTLPPGILYENPSVSAISPRGITREISHKGMTLTETSEHFVDHLYNDAVNLCTIGYGHLLPPKRPCNGSEPAEFRPKITLARGEQLLAGDMQLAERAVTDTTRSDLTDGQFAALCDFVFNVGVQNFTTSTLIQVVNSGQFELVPTELRRWRLAKGKVLPGLVTRRELEIALFFDGRPPPTGTPRGFEEAPIDILKGEDNR